jgi:hypothetical protein
MGQRVPHGHQAKHRGLTTAGSPYATAPKASTPDSGVLAVEMGCAKQTIQRSAQWQKVTDQAPKTDKQYEGLRKKGMYVSGGGYLELAPGLQQQRQEPRQRPK